MKVRVTFTPYDEIADPANPTGLTEKAYEALFDAVPGEDIQIEREE
jgi:hypothetical protein